MLSAAVPSSGGGWSCAPALMSTRARKVRAWFSGITRLRGWVNWPGCHVSPRRVQSARNCSGLTVSGGGDELDDDGAVADAGGVALPPGVPGWGTGGPAGDDRGASVVGAPALPLSSLLPPHPVRS